MKTKLNFLISWSIFAFFIFHFSFVLGQWEWQNPLPQGNNLNDIFFINQHSGWAVGDAGTIIKSEDGGLSYEVINFPTNLNLFTVEFYDVNSGLSVGDSGLILKTSDGGLSWDRTEAGIIEKLTDLCLINPGKAWITGTDGTILYSDNLGETWQVQYSDTLSSFNSVCFTDGSTGWAAGACSLGNAIFHTIDGGNAWELQYLNDTTVLSKVYFLDSAHGWVLGDGSLFHTNDGGYTWETQISPPPGGVTHPDFRDIFFIDENNGCIVGQSFSIPVPGGFILYTEDGGSTWNGGNMNGFNLWHGLNSVFFTDTAHGLSAGTNGNLVRTADGGQNWDIICAAGYGEDLLMDIFFTDSNNGWTVGGSKYPSASKILHTADGGNSWTEQEAPSNFLHSVYFINPLEGWIAGGWTWGNNTNIILHTTNAGLSWETQYLHNGTSYGLTLRDICFTDAEHGWAVGGTEDHVPPIGPPLLLQTEDGGMNWEDHSTLTDKSLSAVYFTDLDHGWIAGFNIILHTTNGGETWEEQWTGNYSLVDICFVDQNHGWVIGDSLDNSPVLDIVMRTTDGGITWEEDFFETGSWLKKIYFTDLSHGWIVKDGGILYTNDGGITWEHQFANTNSLTSVFFLDNDIGWAEGSNCAILHTENGGTVEVKEPPISIQSSKFKVQNYPNPTCGMVDFRLLVPRAEPEGTMDDGRGVTMKIYDMHGREVAAVLDKKMPAGEHVVHFDLSYLQDGIYFVRAMAGDEAATGKLVKMR